MDYCYPDATEEAEVRRVQRIRERKEAGQEEAEDEMPEGTKATLVVYDGLRKNIFAREVSGKGACLDAIALVIGALEVLG